MAKEPKGTFSVTLKVGEHGLEPILGAAYLLTDRAYVRLEGDRGKAVTVTLQPKGAEPIAELRLAFTRELALQKSRWTVARNNQAVRDHVAELAVLQANGRLPAEEPSSDDLTPEQRSEVDRLIAEVEVEISELRKRKDLGDPKKIAATWEEKNKQSPGQGEGA